MRTTGPARFLVSAMPNNNEEKSAATAATITQWCEAIMCDAPAAARVELDTAHVAKPSIRSSDDVYYVTRRIERHV